MMFRIRRGEKSIKTRNISRFRFIYFFFFRKLGEADSEEEIDFMIYLNHAQYELRYNNSGKNRKRYDLDLKGKTLFVV